MNKNDLEKTILMPSIESELKKEKRKEKRIVTKIIIALFIIASSFSLFLFYGPMPFFSQFLDNFSDDFYVSSIFGYLVL